MVSQAGLNVRRCRFQSSQVVPILICAVRLAGLHLLQWLTQSRCMVTCRIVTDVMQQSSYTSLVGLVSAAVVYVTAEPLLAHTQKEP